MALKRVDEMGELEEDMISEALLSELKAIAEGNFELCGDPLTVGISIERSEASHTKSNRLNLLSLGALTAHNFDHGGIDAQSNIATNEEVDSCHEPLILLHSDHGSKTFFSHTRGEANQVASGAYGSELEYSNSHFH